MDTKIVQAFQAGVQDLGPKLIELVSEAVTTFLPIITAVAVVWVGIKLYRRFAAKSGA